jgi:hypothetical protein
MKRRTLTILLLALGLAVSVSHLSLRADEGFWTYNMIPKADIKAACGFGVTDEWVKHLQLSSVRFGGTSGSFISPDGLVLTNHHVGLGAVTRLSTPEKDYVKNGYYAATRDAELKVPGIELSVLLSLEDVTDDVNAAVSEPSGAPGNRPRVVR